MTDDLTRELLQAIRELTEAVRAMSRPVSPLMPIEEVCEELGCSRSKVYQLLREGYLERARRTGKHLRVTRSSFEGYVGIGERERRRERARIRRGAAAEEPERGHRFRDLLRKMPPRE